MKNRMKRKAKAFTACLFALLGVSMIAGFPQDSMAQRRISRESGNVEYTGNILYFGGRRGATATNFTVRLNSFTPAAEVENILSTLRNGGQDQLMRTISKEKLGTVQIGTQLGRDINAAWITEEDEGRKITILFERWVGFSELRYGARSLDYPFTYLEIFLDDRGKGEGTLIPAAKVRYKGGKTIEVENFGIYPARLTNIEGRRR